MLYSLRWYLLCLITVLEYVTSVIVQDITTTTQYGTILGRRHSEPYGIPTSVTSLIDKYLGVPYASPPIGNLRFRPPQPPQPWRPAVHNSTVFGSVCPQSAFHINTAVQFQDEDCLYLDIYTPFMPEARADQLFPVLVFIHGGSYEVGAGKLFDGTVLAQHGVVVVTINYRLGALGFMTTGDDYIPGNLGLRDQIAALSWVHDNIQRFRGNADQVTIMGQSSGSASVGMLMLMPQTRGLFRSAICMSGSATGSYGVYSAQLDHHQYVEQVGQIFGCLLPASMTDIVTCLRAIPAQQYIMKRTEFPRYDMIDPEFKPLVDGLYITDVPRNLFRNGRFHRVPIILGTVKDEFANYFDGERHIPNIESALDNFTRDYLGSTGLVEVVEYLYTDWFSAPVSVHDRGALLSDINMYAPTTDMSDLISQHQPNVYQYHFSVNYSYHSVDLNYVFGAPYSRRYADEMDTPSRNLTFTDRERDLCVLMMSLWTDFVKYGRPTGNNVTSSVRMRGGQDEVTYESRTNESVVWLQYALPQRQYLLLDDHRSVMKFNLRADKAAFWNFLFPKLTGGAVSSPSTQGDETAWQVSPHVWVLLAALATLVIIVACLTALLIRTKRMSESTSTSVEVTPV